MLSSCRRLVSSSGRVVPHPTESLIRKASISTSLHRQPPTPPSPLKLYDTRTPPHCFLKTKGASQFYHGKRNMSASWQSLPTDLPKPIDDGACDHLEGSKFPSLQLPSTAGNAVDVSSLSGLTVVFIYPRTGAPNETVPDEWNNIPGARGCTPQACSFRDASKEFVELGVNHLFGCSTQDTPYQQELRERTHLPYQILSDEKLELARALNLPTFEFNSLTLIKRLTLAIEDGKIVKVWYPVFPSDKNAGEVLEWLHTRTGREKLSNDAENEMARNLQHR